MKLRPGKKGIWYDIARYEINASCYPGNGRNHLGVGEAGEDFLGADAIYLLLDDDWNAAADTGGKTTAGWNLAKVLATAR